MIALHDRRVPGTKGNIDHLVIGPAGVDIRGRQTLVCSGELLDASGVDGLARTLAEAFPAK